MRETLGWSLFVVSAVLFVASGVRAGDPWTVAGGVVFGVASLLFFRR